MAFTTEQKMDYFAYLCGNMIRELDESDDKQKEVKRILTEVESKLLSISSNTENYSSESC